MGTCVVQGLCTDISTVRTKMHTIQVLKVAQPGDFVLMF